MENSNLPRTRLKPLMPLGRPFEAGFCFKPTCQELILYLYKKVTRLPYPKHIIRDCDDIYGDEEGINEPWNLLDASDNTGDYFFVFTHLKKISTHCDKSKKINRKAGSGSWVGNASTNVKNHEGKVIGVNKYYKFELKGGVEVDHRSRSKHGEWTMHEFSLAHKQSPGDVVLCVIGCNSTISVTDDAESSTIFDEQFCIRRMGNVNPTSVVAADLSANSAPGSNNRFLDSSNTLKSEERVMQGENQHILRESTFEQQTDSGSLMAVVQQRLSAYGMEDQKNSRKRAHGSSGNFSPVSSQSDFSDQQQTHSGAVMVNSGAVMVNAYPVKRFRKQQAMPLSSYDRLHTMQQPSFSDFGDAFHSAPANCNQNPDLLQMFHGTGIPNSFLEQQAMPPLFSNDLLHTQQLPGVPGYLDDSKPQPHQPQVDPVAEEGHQQLNEVMDDIEKTTESRGIPLEDYYDELLDNIELLSKKAQENSRQLSIVW